MSKGNKYKAVKTVVDGITFASKAEAKHYGELKLLERAGEIRDLTLQPKFPIVIGQKVAFTYVSDFGYFQGNKSVAADVKGFKTPLYRLKIKCARLQFPGVEFVEIAA